MKLKIVKSYAKNYDYSYIKHNYHEIFKKNYIFISDQFKEYRYTKYCINEGNISKKFFDNEILFNEIEANIILKTLESDKECLFNVRDPSKLFPEEFRMSKMYQEMVSLIFKNKLARTLEIEIIE